MEATHLILALVVVALFGLAAALVMRTVGKRDRQAIDAHVLALWEALALARQDLRLEVNERGERFLHGTARGVRYTLAVQSPGKGWAGTLGATARIVREPQTRLVVWPAGELPAWAPRLPRTVKTGHQEFDEVFSLHTDDEALALAAVDASVREGLLGIPGAALVCDEAKLTLVTSLEERNVDAELVDQVRAVVAGLCAPAEADAPGL